MIKIFFLSFIILFDNLYADEVKVADVKVKCSTERICTFDVTLKHKDTGWEHFANKWEIYTPENKLIATRILHHPHVNEQPFTRSLSDIKIPKGINKVIVKGHDLIHGYSDIFVYEIK